MTEIENLRAAIKEKEKELLQIRQELKFLREVQSREPEVLRLEAASVHVCRLEGKK